ncbi:hypothetical protein RN001_010184 [Aquatica leii]|uniref:MADF domain-containing protein n=1 Tax=Aquatica leii TaxID=1421715 RepID=A0AAN7SN73_9COLE|nr:hypothetical protein RN001_010184 [Aquatica leii]
MSGNLDKIDIELFIGAVQEHPAIWNVALEEYHDRNKKRNAWITIARQFQEGFDEMEDKEKKFICNTSTKKWKNIKDNFMKSVKKKTKSGEAADLGRRVIANISTGGIARLIGVCWDLILSDELDIQESSNDEEDQDNSDIDQSETLKVKPKIATSSKNDKDVVFQALKRKRCVSKTPDSGINSAITAFEDIVEQNEGNTDDEYDIFDDLLVLEFCNTIANLLTTTVIQRTVLDVKNKLIWERLEMKEIDRSRVMRKRRAAARSRKKRTDNPKTFKKKKIKRAGEEPNSDVYKIGERSRRKRINYLEGLRTVSDDDITRQPPRTEESDDEYAVHKDEDPQNDWPTKTIVTYLESITSYVIYHCLLIPNQSQKKEENQN